MQKLVIATDATVLRKNLMGILLPDANELICCAKFGAPLRASRILQLVAEVNGLTRDGAIITLKDPVGLLHP